MEGIINKRTVYVVARNNGSKTLYLVKSDSWTEHVSSATQKTLNGANDRKAKIHAKYNDVQVCAVTTVVTPVGKEDIVHTVALEQEHKIKQTPKTSTNTSNNVAQSIRYRQYKDWGVRCTEVKCKYLQCCAQHVSANFNRMSHGITPILRVKDSHILCHTTNTPGEKTLKYFKPVNFELNGMTHLNI